MKNKAYDIASYSYKKGEIFLFDANIWLYISAPPSSATVGQWNKKYSQALKDILSAHSRLVVSSTILSEYLNRYCRIEWEALHKATHPNFKKFRQSSAFNAIGIQAAAEANQILSLCGKYNDHFETCNVGPMLTQFENGSLDFNDGMISHFCSAHDCKLVTNDADFTMGGIEILTANRSLLAACPC
ncbi:PIN domain-containing protein [Achromobacter insolitus]|uniref:PIN domain-containing protein n=1 Tax=Achromobacter insolitus TaxID=217204 RepID=UPI00174C2D02|nr:PIN domain-containing protein [Achromobacter insolitus]